MGEYRVGSECDEEKVRQQVHMPTVGTGGDEFCEAAHVYKVGHILRIIKDCDRIQIKEVMFIYHQDRERWGEVDEVEEVEENEKVENENPAAAEFCSCTHVVHSQMTCMFSPQPPDGASCG